MQCANDFIEKRLCEIIYKLKTSPDIKYGQEIENKNFAATDKLFGTPKSTTSRLFVEMSPLPKNIVNLSDNAITIWAERNERQKRWIEREGATTPEEIKAIKRVFSVASNVEEKLLKNFRSDFFYDNTVRDTELMQAKAQDISNKIFGLKEI